MVPFLPVQAPGGLTVGAGYTWEQSALGLDYDLPAFDFNAFSFSDIVNHVSHLAIDTLNVTWPHRRFAPRKPSVHF